MCGRLPDPIPRQMVGYCVLYLFGSLWYPRQMPQRRVLSRIAKEAAVPEAETVHHMQNFFDCVRSRKQPIAPIEAGYAHSVAVIMADEAMQSGRRVMYDPAKREIRPA